MSKAEAEAALAFPRSVFVIRHSRIVIMKTLLIWLLVALPLGWGVTKSVEKSLPLFGVEPPVTAPAAK
jgi:hypothetical protein